MPIVFFGDIVRFQKLMRSSGLSREQMLDAQHAIERRIAAAAEIPEKRGVHLVGAVEAMRREKHRLAAEAAEEAEAAGAIEPRSVRPRQLSPPM